MILALLGRKWNLIFALLLASYTFNAISSEIKERALKVEQYVKFRLSVDPFDADYPRRNFRSCARQDSERTTNLTMRKWHEQHALFFEDIESQLSRCARPNYFPRTLSANQISWKSRPKQTDALNSSISNGKTASNGSFLEGSNCTIPQSSNATAHDNTNHTTPYGIVCVNGTWVVQANVTEHQTPLNTSSSRLPPNSNKTVHEVIHPYLVFAILLPQHPFSSDMLESLKVVAPMYPHIAMVIGSAYEFSDFCNQYNARSFPTLLFFKQGLLKHKYKRQLNPWELAHELTRWTNALPTAAPDTGVPYRWLIPSPDSNVTGSASLFNYFSASFASYVNRSHIGYPSQMGQSALASWPSKEMYKALTWLKMKISLIPGIDSYLDSLTEVSDKFWMSLTRRSLEPLAGTSEYMGGNDVSLRITAGCVCYVLGRVVYKAVSPRGG